ncbi:MAG TPA: RidA family protein [Candidatus Limivivens merdigallinarum]|uniref:RidA family protein n=1 Tax=Candidatus Limivivens merdigallinarum TaxID=2840859 RepID=A0A9D0ZVJ9_9FIRM|nr:RidA family protein [Candidatus Limivivens merdigallinarum]
MGIQEKMKQLHITLPEPPAKGGVYASVKELSEGLYYISGCGGYFGTEGPAGKVGSDLTVEEGQEAAKRAMLNFLSVVNANLGGLDRIESFVKVLVFVACAPDFYDQPKVANGATQLLVDIFGEEIGAPSRSAIGAPCLPGNTPVEIEGIVRVRR